MEERGILTHVLHNSCIMIIRAGLIVHQEKSDTVFIALVASCFQICP